jgi:predicted tellurium resistance membrane protein TerC
LSAGLVFFGLVGSRMFWYGFEKVELYTWIALGFGVVSFGFLAKWFGREFWQRLFGS